MKCDEYQWKFYSYRSNSDSEDDADTPEQEYPSLDSSDNSLQGPMTFSPRNTEPPSLTESMQLMDEVLSNKTMDRYERIDKLEALLSAATLLPNESAFSSLQSDYNTSTYYNNNTNIIEEPSKLQKDANQK